MTIKVKHGVFLHFLDTYSNDIQIGCSRFSIHYSFCWYEMVWNLLSIIWIIFHVPCYYCKVNSIQVPLFAYDISETRINKNVTANILTLYEHFCRCFLINNNKKLKNTWQVCQNDFLWICISLFWHPVRSL